MYKFGCLYLGHTDYGYGDKNWTCADYKRYNDRKVRWDAHAWLEDKDGNVYDCMYDEYHQDVERLKLYRVAHNQPINNGMKITVPVGPFEKMDKKYLAEHGFEYYEADAETQTAIFCSMFQYMRFLEKHIKLGNIGFSGDNFGLGGFDFTPNIEEVMADAHNEKVKTGKSDILEIVYDFYVKPNQTEQFLKGLKALANRLEK